MARFFKRKMNDNENQDKDFRANLDLPEEGKESADVEKKTEVDPVVEASQIIAENACSNCSGEGLVNNARCNSCNGTGRVS